MICCVVWIVYDALPTELTEVIPRTGLEPVTLGLKGKQIIAVTTPSAKRRFTRGIMRLRRIDISAVIRPFQFWGIPENRRW